MSDSLRVRIGQHSDKGCKEVNQDFHGARVPADRMLATKGVALALADGIGSSPVSHVASQAAVQALMDDYYSTSEAWSVKRSVQRVLAATNAWLHAQTQRGPYRHDKDRGYVCTLSALVLKSRTAHLFHAGDTRIWRLAGRSLEQLTEDHRVWVGGGQSYLSRALGFHPQLELDHAQLSLATGDVFELTSDGVHEHLPAAGMAELVREHEADLDAAAHALVARALAAGSADNLSVQIVRVEALPDGELHEAVGAAGTLPLPPVLQPRMEFDGWRIERELHASHRSHIHLATDLASGRRAVLKTPATEHRADAAWLDRFMLEEWIAQRLDSPHLLKAWSAERARGALYVALEHVEGQTLAQWLRDHPRPSLQTVRSIVERVAAGLNAMHRREMLHQDLRPENVMIDAGGTVRIIDFGSTQVAGLAEAARAADEPAVPGAIAHAAPEYFLGEGGSERSDQYALGVLAYQMLTGRLPYGTRVAMLRQRGDLAGLRYDSARVLRPDVPAWVDGALARATHPDARRRYAALGEFVHDLRHPTPEFARVTAPLAERHPLLLWRLLTALFAFTTLALLAVLAHQRG
jgi:serine/threonine protein phosphatase PrpC